MFIWCFWLARWYEEETELHYNEKGKLFYYNADCLLSGI